MSTTETARHCVVITRREARAILHMDRYKGIPAPGESVVLRTGAVVSRLRRPVGLTAWRLTGVAEDRSDIEMYEEKALRVRLGEAKRNRERAKQKFEGRA